MVSSFYWVVDPSDAPYSVVALFLDDRRNIFEFFFWRVLMCVSFSRSAQSNSIRALNSEVTAWLFFRHVYTIHWGASCKATIGFVYSGI